MQYNETKRIGMFLSKLKGVEPLVGYGWTDFPVYRCSFIII